MIFPKPKQSLTIKQITLEEMKECRDKGICYNFDEKYGLGHRCIIHKLYFLNTDSLEDLIDEEDEVKLEEVANESNNIEDEVPKISYNALSNDEISRILKG